MDEAEEYAQKEEAVHGMSDAVAYQRSRIAFQKKDLAKATEYLEQASLLNPV